MSGLPVSEKNVTVPGTKEEWKEYERENCIRAGSGGGRPRRCKKLREDSEDEVGSQEKKLRQKERCDEKTAG